MSITILIIIATALVSWRSFDNPGSISTLAHYPYAEHHRKEYYRWITHGFVHGDVFHLFVNMFVLYGFGAYLEHRFQIEYGLHWGRMVFLVFYLLVLILPALVSMVKHKDNKMYRSIGASGATSGVLFAYILYEPLNILELYFILPIPAIVFGILYLWYSHWASRNRSDLIDHDAHFFGALAGMLLLIAIQPKVILHFLHHISRIF